MNLKICTRILLVKLIKYLLLSLIFLSLFSCSNREDKNGISLKIGKCDCYNDLTDKLIKAFEKKTGLKLGSEVLSPDKALAKLLNGKIDIYIGNLDLPTEVTNIVDEVLLCKDGLVIITHPSNPIGNLNKVDLIKIFTRNIRNWKTFNGQNQPIIVIDRNEDSSERRNLLKSLFESSNVDIPTNVTVKNHEELLKAISTFPNAISYMNFSADKENLKTININNISPSKLNISQGYFPLTREINVYYNKKSLQDSGKDALVNKFIEFLYGSEGQYIVIEEELVPLSAAEIELMKLRHNTISIGVAAPMEGSYTDLGRSIVNAAKLAIDERNLENGVKGRALKLIICNDRANTKLAINCANKFVENKAWGVIGHLTSKETIEASKIYRENKIPLLSPGSTHPWLTERPSSRGFVFRTTGRDDQQARLIYKIIKDLNYPDLKVGIFHNGTVYGSNASSLIEHELRNNLKIKNLVVKTVKQDQGNYQNELKDLDSNILVYVGEYGDAAKLIKELALSNKKDIVFIGTDGIFSQRFIERAGLRAEGAYVIGNTVDSESELANDFEIKYKARFGVDSTAYAMNSYDSINMLLDAIEKSDLELNKYTPEKVAKVLQDMSYQGVTGEIKFNKIGDIEKPRMAVYRVLNGKFVRE